ncbi:MAG: hypothetical protein ACRDKA_01710 [Actinomycetota bacterium]
MLRRRRNALVLAAVLPLGALAGCRASGEIDVDENDGDTGIEVDVGDDGEG